MTKRSKRTFALKAIAQKSWNLLNPEERKVFGVFLAAQIATNFLDILALYLLGSVTIAATLPKQANVTFKRPIIREILSLTNLTPSTTLSFLAILSITLFCLKSTLTPLLNRLFLSRIAHIQIRVIQEITAKLTTGRLGKLANVSSQDIAYALTEGANHALIYIPVNLMTLGADMTLTLFFVLFIFIYNPLVCFLIIVLLAFVSSIYHHFTGHRIKSNSQLLSFSGINSIQTSQDLVLGIREIRAYRRERFFKERFLLPRISASKGLTESLFYAQLPRYFLELCLLLFSSAIVSLLVIQKTLLEAIAYGVTFFALAGRLMPTLLRIQAAVNGITISSTMAISVNELLEALNEGLQDPTPSATPFQDLKKHTNISVINVSFSFDGGPNVIKDLTVDIPQGSHIAIVGASGAGKSTLLDLLLGFVLPDSGKILLGDSPVPGLLKAKSFNIGYVPQRSIFMNTSIADNVYFGSDVHDEGFLKEVLKQVQLEDWIDSLPHGLHTKMGELGSLVSGGERQRLSLARAIYSKPHVLILDEALNSLDNTTSHAIRKLLISFRGEVTVLAVTHTLSQAEIADKVLFLEGDGSYSFDTYNNLLHNNLHFKNLNNAGNLNS